MGVVAQLVRLARADADLDAEPRLLAVALLDPRAAADRALARVGVVLVRVIRAAQQRGAAPAPAADATRGRGDGAGGGGVPLHRGRDDVRLALIREHRRRRVGPPLAIERRRGGRHRGGGGVGWSTAGGAAAATRGGGRSGCECRSAARRRHVPPRCAVAGVVGAQQQAPPAPRLAAVDALRVSRRRALIHDGGGDRARAARAERGAVALEGARAAGAKARAPRRSGRARLRRGRRRGLGRGAACVHRRWRRRRQRRTPRRGRRRAGWGWQRRAAGARWTEWARSAVATMTTLRRPRGASRAATARGRPAWAARRRSSACNSTSLVCAPSSCRCRRGPRGIPEGSSPSQSAPRAPCRRPAGPMRPRSPWIAEARSAAPALCAPSAADRRPCGGGGR